jgi:hypothetical protein
MKTFQEALALEQGGAQARRYSVAEKWVQSPPPEPPRAFHWNWWGHLAC